MDTKITPAEIRGKEFSRVMSGYKKAEVNEFLEELATQTELLLAATKELEKQIQEKDKKLDDLDEQKDLLRKTLILAEKIKDETINNAKNEAENIIKDAEISSREKVKKAKDYLSILEHDFINLKEKKMQFIVNFKSQLNSMLEILERNIQQESSELKKKSNIEIKKKEEKTL